MRRGLALVLAAGLVACAPAGEERPSGLASVLPPPVPGALPPPVGSELVMPLGYGANVVAADLVDPRAVVISPSGQVYVVEGTSARLTRVEAGGTLFPVATGGGNGPWTGAAMLDGRLYVAEAGGPLGGRILEIGDHGAIAALPARLPAGGLLGPLAAGPDGWLYVGVASPGRAGRDIPCRNLRLAGGGEISGTVPCTGSVLRISRDGRRIEAYAWGFRRPVSLAFTPSGQLLVADDVTEGVGGGKFPAERAPDMLWAAVPGLWYGWPQAAGELASSEPELAALPNPPPAPAATIPGRVAAVTVVPESTRAFGPAGRPLVVFDAPSGTGQVTIADTANGGEKRFIGNLADPSALAFAPNGTALWIADAGTGRLWKVTAFQ
ncbi:MAG: hypothetical protein M0006_13150 [Magnetospirillum sp.]|nr:hypothetical protein [Magnetospirillum sp.]